MNAPDLRELLEVRRLEAVGSGRRRRRRRRRRGPGRRAGSGRRSAAAGVRRRRVLVVSPVPSGGCSQPTSSAGPVGGAGAASGAATQPRTTGSAGPSGAGDRERGHHPVAVAPVVLAAGDETVPSGTQVPSIVDRLADPVAGNGSSGPIASASGTGSCCGQVGGLGRAALLPGVVLPGAEPTGGDHAGQRQQVRAPEPRGEQAGHARPDYGHWHGPTRKPASQLVIPLDHRPGRRLRSPACRCSP